MTRISSLEVCDHCGSPTELWSVDCNGNVICIACQAEELDGSVIDREYI